MSYNRVSGIGIIGNVPWGTHFCQFYQTKEDLIDILVPYFKAGLENNEFCMWITSELLGVEEAKEAFRRSVPDFDIYLEKGQIEIIPYTRWYVKDGIFDSDRVLKGWVEKLNQALVNGYDGLRLTVNTFWLEKKDWNAFFDYEEEIDRVLGNCNMISLCTYSLDRCNATEIIDVVANHQFALIKRDGKWEQIESSKRKQADITHRDALFEAERFRQALEYVPSYVYMKDLQSRYIYANKHTLELFGCSAKELIGCDDACFFPPETVKRLREVDLRVFSGEQTYEEIDVAYIGSGRRVYLEIKTPIYLKSENKTIYGLLGISTDITEHKHAEEALALTQASVDLASDNILWITPGGKVSYANNAACKSLQYFRDELQRMYVWDFNPLYTEEKWLEQWLEIKKRSSFTFETLHRAKDGREFPVEVSVNYVRSGDIEFVFAYIKDITECKKAEDLIKTAAINLSRAERLASLGHWDWDLTTNQVKWSDGHFRIFGYTVAHGTETYEMWRARVHPEDIEDIERVLREGMEKDTGYNWDYRLLLPDGSIRYVHVEADRPVRDASGKPVRWFGTVQNITERKLVEEALRESKERYRTFFNTSAMGTVEIDLTGRLTKVNDRYCQITGYSREELLEMNAAALSHPDDYDCDHRLLNDYLSGGTPMFDVEKRYVRKDGRIIWVQITAEIVHDAEGKPLRSIGIAQDITERKKAQEPLRESEECFSKAFYSSPAASCITRLSDGCFVDANESYLKMFGYSWQEIVGHTSTELGMYSSYTVSRDELLILFQKNGHIHNFEMNFRTKAGKAIRAIFSTEAINIKDQPHLITTLLDITERKRAEENLKKTHETLEEKVKERTAELEEAYNSLLENEIRLNEAQKIAHLGNWDWNPETDKVYWSNEMYRIFRLDPLEFGATYDAFLNYVHPEDRDYVDNAVKEALSGKPTNIDYRVILANGEERIVHAMGKVTFDEKGTHVRVRGTLQDITERKQMEESLRESEEKYRTLFNSIDEGFCVIDMIFDVNGKPIDYRFLEMNPAFEKQTGMYEAIGKTMREFVPNHEGHWFETYGSIVFTGEPKRFIAEANPLMGGWCDVYASQFGGRESNKVAIVFNDITEQKRAEKALRKSEERLRRFYDSGMFGVFYYNLDGSVTEANDKFLEMIGYTQDDLQAGLIQWDKMTPPEYRSLDEYAIAELKATGMNTPYEKEFIHKDGSRIPIFLGAATIVEARNEGVVFVLDITEKKEGEEALAKIEIVRKQEIHHRIKNNLQVISSLLDLQAETFRDQECIRDSEVLEAFRESQDRVISMALIHEELYEGDGFETLNFSPYIQKLIESLFQTYSIGNIDINLNMDMVEDAFFDMDTAVPLGIIVNELVSNSFKHAFKDRDRGEIQIKLNREESEDCESASFTLTVSDNGVGIPENFEIEDLDSLGMQLVTTLVDQLDGELELKRNNGTEFTMKFAVMENNNQATAPALQ